LGKNKKIISSITHQLSFKTNPLTVLLIPPNNSPVGSAGREKGRGNRLRAGEAAGYDDGGHAAGGNALYADECLRPIIKPPFKGIWNEMNPYSII